MTSRFTCPTLVPTAHHMYKKTAPSNFELCKNSYATFGILWVIKRSSYIQLQKLASLQPQTWTLPHSRSRPCRHCFIYYESERFRAISWNLKLSICFFLCLSPSWFPKLIWLLLFVLQISTGSYASESKFWVMIEVGASARLEEFFYHLLNFKSLGRPVHRCWNEAKGRHFVQNYWLWMYLRAFEVNQGYWEIRNSI